MNSSLRPDVRDILVVDDHPVLRRGLKALIETDPSLRVCAEADCHAGAMVAVEDLEPDLVIVDISLRGSNGLDLITDMKRQFPKIPALVMSTFNEVIYAERSIKVGALGYVNKNQLDETVMVAIDRALAGQLYLSEKLNARLAEKFLGGHTMGKLSAIDVLSQRELQVFEQVGQGRTTRQIAGTLDLSIKTIESHLEHIKSKLTIGSAAELTHRATLWVQANC